MERNIVTCKRCGYVWMTRHAVPVKCASCDSKYWNIEKGTLSKGRPRREKMPQPEGVS